MENEIKNMRLVQIRDEKHCNFVEYVAKEDLDESKQIYITDEDRMAIGKTKCFDLENNCVIDYDNTIDKIIEHKNELRARRQSICFPIINRGQFWYDTLTKSQKEELKTWYQAWLDVTETMEEPVVPDFLSKELERFYIVREEPVIEQTPEIEIEEIVEELIDSEIVDEIPIEEFAEDEVVNEETEEQEVIEDEE